MGCMAIRPVVDGIEQEHAQELIVLRVNAQDPAGVVLADRYTLAFTPSFLFFDPAGQIQWRTVGALDPDEVRRSLEQP